MGYNILPSDKPGLKKKGRKKMSTEEIQMVIDGCLTGLLFIGGFGLFGYIAYLVTRD